MFVSSAPGCAVILGVWGGGVRGGDEAGGWCDRFSY
jgi:hypothetical protein